DPHHHGRPAARPVAEEPQGPDVRHPRPGGGDRPLGPGGGDVVRAVVAPDRRFRHRPAAPAPYRRHPPRAALPRARARELAYPQERGAARLRPGRGEGRMSPPSRPLLVALQILVAVLGLAFWHVLTTTPLLGDPKVMQFFFSTPYDVLARCVSDLAG